jgi:hypothetical protein
MKLSLSLNLILFFSFITLSCTAEDEKALLFAHLPTICIQARNLSKTESEFVKVYSEETAALIISVDPHAKTIHCQIKGLNKVHRHYQVYLEALLTSFTRYIKENEKPFSRFINNVIDMNAVNRYYYLSKKHFEQELALATPEEITSFIVHKYIDEDASQSYSLTKKESIGLQEEIERGENYVVCKYNAATQYLEKFEETFQIIKSTLQKYLVFHGNTEGELSFHLAKNIEPPINIFSSLGMTIKCFELNSVCSLESKNSQNHNSTSHFSLTGFLYLPPEYYELKDNYQPTIALLDKVDTYKEALKQAKRQIIKENAHLAINSFLDCQFESFKQQLDRWKSKLHQKVEVFCEKIRKIV